METQINFAAWTTGILGAIALINIFILARRRLYGKYRHFPGPMSLPVFGNALSFIGCDPLAHLDKLRKQYGDVFCINFFGKNIVVVNGEDMIQEMLIERSTEFAGRPASFRFKYVVDWANEVVFSDYSPQWALRKKELMNAIKTYGERQKSLETITQDILQHKCGELEKKVGEEFDIYPVIHCILTEIMTSVVFGRLLDNKANEEIALLDYAFLENCSPLDDGAEIDIFPWLRFLPNKSFMKLKNMVQGINAFLRKEIDENIKEHDPDNPRCILDSLLKFQKKIATENGNKVLSDHDVLKLVQNVFLAGTSTSSFALYALVAVLAEKHEIQIKLQAQIDEHIGSRIPSLDDIKDMPYVVATIFEILRFASTVPFAPHATTRETTLGGYTLPKDTEIWPNIWNLHHDPNTFPDPWNFLPERFLDDDNQLLPPTHRTRRNHLPFGAGRRVCAGSTLARNRMFLFITTILQRFTILPPEDAASLPTDPREYKLSLARLPRPFKVKLKTRDQ
jgi:cytochrome P450